MATMNWIFVTVSLTIIALAGFLVYSNTFNVPFVFDDIHSIVESRARRQPNWGWRSWLGTRALPSKTLDLNYRFNKLDVTGYHAVNLLVHILASLGAFVVAYGLAKQSLPRHRWQFYGLAADNWQIIATVAGLMFVLHPIQTQAVTYIVQRLASIATMFYLWSLATYILYRQTKNKKRYIWAALSLLAMLASMHSKEMSIIIPIAIVFLELIFFSQNWRSFYQQIPKMWPWLVCILIIPIYLGGLLEEDSFQLFRKLAGGELDFSWQLDPRSQSEVIKEGIVQNGNELSVEYVLSRFVPTSAETVEINRYNYFLTELNVLKTYLRLLVLPINQNLDYDYRLSATILELETTGSLALILFVLLAGWWLWSKGWKLAAYGIVIFFLGQVIESSVFPIKDVIFEHRVYFSFIGFALLFADLTHWLLSLTQDKYWRFINLQSTVLTLIFLLLIALGVATWRRNAVWGSEISLWTDVSQKSPKKSRAYNNLGVSYMRERDFVKAEENYLKELALDPASVSAHVNLGSIYGQQGRYDEALDYLEKAVSFNPASASAWNNLGNVMRQTNRLPEAENAYKQSLSIAKDDAETWYNLALIYINQQRTNDAMPAIRHAVELKPEQADWQNKLGALLAMQGDLVAGEEHLREAIRLDSQLMPAYSNLGNVISARGSYTEAAELYAKYLEVKPDDPSVLASMGDVLVKMNLKEQAQTAYQKALRIQPGYQRAQAGLESVKQ